MKRKPILALLPLAAAFSLLPATTYGQLRITEVESSENAGSKPDWWEVTNFGNNPVDITSYRMDDDSASFGLSVLLTGISSVAPGESVAFFESAGSTPLTVQGFRTWWGLGPTTQIGFYLGSGAGVSLGASGDAVNLYTSGGTLVNGVTFGAATKGVTFGWNPISQTFGGLSQTSLYGAYVAPQDGDIGSPGVVPEPSALVLSMAGMAAFLIRRRC